MLETRREKRRQRKNKESILDSIQDDFLDVEENFRETPIILTPKQEPKVFSEKTQEMTLEVSKPEKKQASKPKKAVPKSEPEKTKTSEGNARRTQREQLGNLKGTLGEQIPSHASFCRNPNRLEYLMLRGENKEFLNLVISHVSPEEPSWIIGSQEIMEITGYNSEYVKQVIKRLKKKGFIHTHRGFGERAITVNPSIAEM